MPEWVERLRMPAAVILVVIIGMAAVSLAGPAASRSASSLGAAPSPAPSPTPTPAPPRPIKVHIAGAVRAPNVYVLTTESRVADALAAAGGPTSDADPHRLNLAAFLQDGEQIVVPRVGESLPQPPVAAVSPRAGDPTTTDLVDLNRASAAELETLPGIGKVTAEKILRSREADGPFTTVDDLRERKLIGPATLDKVRNQLVVR